MSSIQAAKLLRQTFSPMHVVKSVLIAAASTVLSAGAAELVIRIAHPAPVIFGFSIRARGSSFEPSQNPILGYTLKPNVRNEKADCHDSFPYTNAFGLRDNERQLERKAGTKRVLLLGDSVVAGHGLCDLNETISRKLEPRLGETSEVLNFGIGGYCTRSEVELLKEKGLQFHPDLVTLLFVNNDYMNSNGSLLRSFQSPIPSLVRFSFIHSHLFRWTALLTNLYHLRSDLDARAAYTEHRHAVGAGNIESGMELLHQLSEQEHFKVLVALWPYFLDKGIHEPTPGGNEDETKPLLIESLASRYGFESQRLSPGFRADVKRLRAEHPRAKRPSPRWTYTIGDGTHPSSAGTELAAKLLEPTIRHLLELPESRASEESPKPQGPDSDTPPGT